MAVHVQWAPAYGENLGSLGHCTNCVNPLNAEVILFMTVEVVPILAL